MYHHSKLIKNEFGLEEYEMPVQHFDALKMAKDKDLYEKAVKGKKKKPGKLKMDAKRGGNF
jgi:hypothetical protein